MKLNQTLNPISFAERKKINENWEEIVRNIHLLDSKINILAGGDEVDEILARIAKATTDAIKATSDANSATGKADIATNNANSATSKANTAASKADTATASANNKIVEVNQVLADADIKIKAAIKATDDAIVAKRNADTATSKANTSASKADVATGKATTATAQADEATAKAIKATTDTLDAITKAVEATKQATEATEAAITATGKANESANKANTQAEYAKAEGDKAKALTTDLQKAHEDLTPLKNDVVKATADANAATSDATNAYEKIKGWGAATPYAQGTTYNKNNVVTFNGSTYQTKNDGVTQAPPTTSASNDDWILLAQRGVDGKGAVASVDGMLPDGDGNVTLNHANKADVAKALNDAKKYTDEKIGSVDFTEIENSIADNTSKINAHEAKKDNPHSVTKSQIGLGNVDNVKQATKAEFDTHTKQIASADKLGHVKVGDSLEISPDGTLNVISHNYFGVRIDKTNSNPKTAVTRIGKSKGMNANDFWNVYPYNAIRAVLVKNGVVQAELNKDLSHNYVASDGDIFTELPKFWWKFENSPTHLEIKIATAEVEGFVSPAFESKEKIYIGRYLGYELDGKLRSVKGYEPTGSKTIGAFRTLAQANGTGYSQLPYLATLAVQVLYLVQYANLDSQTALGRGWVDSPTGYANTGGTDGKGFNYGETTGKLQMSIYGIEDFWGNKRQWLDGIVTDANSDILVSNGNFNDNGDGYTKHANTGAVKDDGGYIKDVMGGDITGFLNADKSGSSTTYYCDSGYISPTKVAYFGGSRSSASTAGAFCLGLISAASSSIAYIGARLYFS